MRKKCDLIHQPNFSCTVCECKRQRHITSNRHGNATPLTSHSLQCDQSRRASILIRKVASCRCAKMPRRWKPERSAHHKKLHQYCDRDIYQQKEGKKKTTNPRRELNTEGEEWDTLKFQFSLHTMAPVQQRCSALVGTGIHKINVSGPSLFASSPKFCTKVNNCNIISNRRISTTELSLVCTCNTISIISHIGQEAFVYKAKLHAYRVLTN